jgi:hypothetical protein
MADNSQECMFWLLTFLLLTTVYCPSQDARLYEAQATSRKGVRARSTSCGLPLLLGYKRISLYPTGRVGFFCEPRMFHTENEIHRGVS